MTVGDPHYKTNKGILAAHAETPPDEHGGSAAAGAPAFLRGLEELIGWLTPGGGTNAVH